MSNLIERLERAIGPDRELGREVLLACGWHKTCVGHFMGPMYHWSSPDNRVSFDDDRFYNYDPTGSLDTAVRLVPALCWARVQTETRDARPMAWATNERDEHSFEGVGATPAIALCIAALKARAHAS